MGLERHDKTINDNIFNFGWSNPLMLFGSTLSHFYVQDGSVTLFVVVVRFSQARSLSHVILGSIRCLC